MLPTIGWALVQKHDNIAIDTFNADQFHIYTTRKAAREQQLQHERVVKVRITNLLGFNFLPIT